MRKSVLYIILLAFILAIAAVQRSEASWDFMFSNKAFASNLTVQVFIVAEDQICDLMKDTGDNPSTFIQKTNGELERNRPTYLFIRIKSKGNRQAWGTLFVEVNKYKYTVDIPYIEANQPKWHYSVTYTNQVFWPKNDKPEINFRWKNLYAK